MALQKVTLSNQETIAYRERPGGKQTIILVHGNMTSSKHWDVLMDALDPKYTSLCTRLTRIRGIFLHQTHYTY